MTANGWARRLLRRMVVPFVVAAALAPAREARGAPIKVACIGEQTTHSHSFPTNGVGEYPWMLQMMLGAAYDTRNFGDCCATILQGYPKQPETHPYLAGSEHTAAVAFAPNIVVIGSWGKHDTEIANSLYRGVLDPIKLKADYDTLVTTYLNLASRPKVYVSLPVPIPKGAALGVTTNVILPAIQAVADERRLPVIDLYSAFLDHPELYKDDTHVSDDAGLHKITDLVYAALTAGDDAGAPDAGAPATRDAAGNDATTVDSGNGAGGASGSGTGAAGASGASVGAGGVGGAGGAGQAGGGASTVGAGGGAAGERAAGGAAPNAPSADSDSGCSISNGPPRVDATWFVLAIVVALHARRRTTEAPRRS